MTHLHTHRRAAQTTTTSSRPLFAAKNEKIAERTCQVIDSKSHPSKTVHQTRPFPHRFAPVFASFFVILRTFVHKKRGYGAPRPPLFALSPGPFQQQRDAALKRGRQERLSPRHQSELLRPRRLQIRLDHRASARTVPPRLIADLRNEVRPSPGFFQQPARIPLLLVGRLPFVPRLALSGWAAPREPARTAGGRRRRARSFQHHRVRAKMRRRCLLSPDAAFCKAPPPR